MMNAFCFSVLFSLFFVSAGLISEGTASSGSGLALEQHRSDTTMAVKNRKLKGSGFVESTPNDEPEIINLEDYRPIDPVPSSKASVRPGPIQHGTPLMPYIPKPSPPPDHSMHGVFP